VAVQAVLHEAAQAVQSLHANTHAWAGRRTWLTYIDKVLHMHAFCVPAYALFNSVRESSLITALQLHQSIFLAVICVHSV
jgi:hypothetical protein